MRRLASSLAVAAAALALGPLGVAHAADPAVTIGEDGLTAPTFDYSAAIRERVFIPQPGIDQDGDGSDDRIVVDVIRPSGSGSTLAVPAIVDASPYYTTSGRGNESERIADVDSDGINDRWPLFYDNYFVPRGYAYVLAHANGTGFSTGCPMHGGPGDVAGMKSVIDWLGGRVPAENAAGDPVVASWYNGSSAMFGKSYDGTFANGVAATGVVGLKTIVPISAISAWYDYSRTGGIRHNTHYPATLANYVTNTDRRALCAASRTLLSTLDGDATGDYNDFWQERNYVKDAAKVRAAVFATHGFQDDNVRMNHLSQWWEALKANGVPLKLWLLRAGHTDPFDSRRAAWVDTIHRWFDHYLYGIDNGIDDAPPVTIEDEKDVWHDYADWPVPGTDGVELYLRGSTAVAPGSFGAVPGGAAETLTFTGATSSETTYMNDPTGAQTSRRVFLSPPLRHAVRLSGAASVDLRASLSTAQSNVSALLVDYGAGTQVRRSGEGISTTTTETCWGASSTNDDACYFEVTKPTQDVTQWRVARGELDSSNRDSLWTPAPVAIGEPEELTVPLVATEHTFAAGHRIGIVVAANVSGYGVAGTTGSAITLDTRLSTVTLPLVGGRAAAVGAGIADPDAVAPTLGPLPDDVEVETGDATGIEVTYTAPSATDDEDPDPQVACDPASGTRFPLGTTTVTCTATDAAGNEASGTFTVTVRGPPPDGDDEPGTEPGPGGGEPAPPVTLPAPPPPDVRVVASPPAIGSARDVEIAFVTDAAAVGYECRLDDGPWTACTSPYALAGLRGGDHRLETRAVMADGRRGAVSATTFQVNPYAPGISLPTGVLRVGTGGAVRIRLGCSAREGEGRGACKGTVTLRRTIRRGGRRRTVVLARARFATTAGRTTTARLRLTRAGRRLLARAPRHRLRVQLQVAAHDLADNHRTIRTARTLRAPARVGTLATSQGD